MKITKMILFAMGLICFESNFTMVNAMEENSKRKQLQQKAKLSLNEFVNKNERQVKNEIEEALKKISIDNKIEFIEKLIDYLKIQEKYKDVTTRINNYGFWKKLTGGVGICEELKPILLLSCRLSCIQLKIYNQFSENLQNKITDFFYENAEIGFFQRMFQKFFRYLFSENENKNKNITIIQLMTLFIFQPIFSDNQNMKAIKNILDSIEYSEEEKFNLSIEAFFKILSA
jgi:hypothetical protein